jgi:hypothetical protein
MNTMGIIGTAGRRDDGQRMNQQLWENMLAHAIQAVESWEPDTLVSGGAAWADHIAVELYRAGLVKNLRLYLPAPFKDSKFVAPNDFKHPGSIANYYHRTMSRTLRGSTLRELQLAIDAGAEVQVIPGFKSRNTYVANDSDYLLAFTFGTHSGLYTPAHAGYLDHVAAGLKDGGTADTWDKARSRLKEHKSLWELQNSTV